MKKSAIAYLFGFIIIALFVFTVFSDVFLKYNGYASLSPLPSTLMAYYKFDGNANDYSSQGNNGIVYGAALVQGYKDQAYSFNGVNSRIKVADSTSLDFTNAFTLAGWFYFQDDINSARLIAKEAVGSDPKAGTNDWAYRLITLDNGVFGYHDTLLLQINGISGSISANSSSLPSSVKNRWVHLATTYDGNKIAMYIDGNKISVSQPTILNGSIRNSKSGLGIGATHDGKHPFKGKIDEVAMYNYALSASQIYSLVYPSICGNGIVEPGEQCDNGKHCDNSSACTSDSQCYRPDREGDDVCITRSGDGCSASCMNEIVNNSTCGNNIREGTEVCDGTALNGQTCITQGFTGGTLSCNNACTSFVTSSCTLNNSSCSDSKEINEASSKIVLGLNITNTYSDESDALGIIMTRILVNNIGMNLSVGGNNSIPSQNTWINNKTYNVALIAGSDTASTIKVTDLNCTA